MDMKKIIALFVVAFAFNAVHANDVKPSQNLISSQYQYEDDANLIRRLLQDTQQNASCEDKCYKERSRCIDKAGDSHKCDPAYDRCKAACK